MVSDPRRVSLVVVALTKTEDDGVYADNDILAIAHIQHVSVEFVMPLRPTVGFPNAGPGRALDCGAYIPIGKNCATPPNTINTPIPRLTIRLS